MFPDVDEIVAQYSTRLMGYLTRLGVERNAREDLVNRILTQAWQKRDQLQEEDALECWLFTIAGNEAKRLNRRQKAAKRQAEVVPIDEQHEGPDGPETNPEALLIAKEVEAAAKGCAAKLPNRLKQVFHMVVFQDLSYDLVARNLRINPGTVKSRLSNGRKQVALCLEKLLGRPIR